MSVPSGKTSERTAAPTRQIRTTVSPPPPCSMVVELAPSFAFAAAPPPPPSLLLLATGTESTMSLSGGLAAAIFLGFQPEELDLRRRRKKRRAKRERRRGGGGGAAEAAAAAGAEVAAAASASAGAWSDAGAFPLAISLGKRDWWTKGGRETERLGFEVEERGEK